MAISGIFSSPLAAYQKMQGIAGGAAGAAEGVIPGGSFSDVLANFTTDSMNALKKGEQATMLAAQGKADVTDVVTAVSNAELTLQTIVAVRDRVISAYQDIIRMPI
jgi:flagellar hook-basal body complex protein FliE